MNESDDVEVTSQAKLEVFRAAARSQAVTALRAAGAPSWDETTFVALADHLGFADERPKGALSKTGWAALVLRVALDESEAREATLRDRIEDLARDNLALRLRLEPRKAGVEADMVPR